MSKLARKRIVISLIIFFFSVLVYSFRSSEIYKQIVRLNFLSKRYSYFSKREKIKVRITGMIKRPGTYIVSKGSRLSDLIVLAGGLRRFAYVSKYFKIILKDSEEYYIPFRKLKRGEVVNINKADVLELCTIPYINKKRAEEIIAYREKYGRFDEKEEIKEIDGIGDKRYELIKNFLVIGD